MLASKRYRHAAAGRRSGGFTLIELMVVVLIIAILSIIAINSYLAYVARSKVRTAENDLVALSLNVENYLQRWLVYPDQTTTTTAETVKFFTGWRPAQGADFVYTIQSSKDTYKLIATGSDGRLAKCQLTLDSEGQRLVIGKCASITAW